MSKILIGIILAMGIAGSLYYYFTQNELKTLRDLNAAYEVKHQQQEETLRVMEQDFQLQTSSLQELQVASQQIQIEMNRYLDIFKRHNLSKLAAAKPGLIEKRVNKATKGVFDGIENDSSSLDALDDGVQLSPEAATGSQDNNETSGETDSAASPTTGN
jgi:hypothetical protein